MAPINTKQPNNLNVFENPVNSAIWPIIRGIRKNASPVQNQRKEVKSGRKWAGATSPTKHKWMGKPNPIPTPNRIPTIMNRILFVTLLARINAIAMIIMDGPAISLRGKRSSKFEKNILAITAVTALAVKKQETKRFLSFASADNITRDASAIVKNSIEPSKIRAPFRCKRSVMTPMLFVEEGISTGVNTIAIKRQISATIGDSQM